MKSKYKQIYKFTTDDLNLNFTEFKVYTVLRMFANRTGYTRLRNCEIIPLVKLKSSAVALAIISLQKKGKIIIIEDNDIGRIIYVADFIDSHEQFFFWIPEDLDLGLSYRELQVYCLIRNYSMKVGYSTIKLNNIVDLLKINKKYLLKLIKKLKDKNLIITKKINGITRYKINDSKDPPDKK